MSENSENNISKTDIKYVNENNFKKQIKIFKNVLTNKRPYVILNTTKETRENKKEREDDSNGLRSLDDIHTN